MLDSVQWRGLVIVHGESELKDFDNDNLYSLTINTGQVKKKQQQLKMGK